MKMLVTGAAGFIGSNHVDRLLSDGHEVAGVDDLTNGRMGNLGSAVSVKSRFRFDQIDITTM